MNTLKFGNGEWYGKKDTVLAYNDLNSNFKPLPFNFDRSSSATRVNKQGLIETVGSGEPRIDYKDDSKGALLLEPSRSNRFYYSEDFSNSIWVKQNVNLTSNYELSPSGFLNADRVITTNTGVDLYQNISVSANTTYTLTFYAKLRDGENIQARFYDLSNSSNISYVNYSSQLSNNEWKRVEIEVTTPLGCTSLRIWIVALTSTLIDVSYWGAQLEQGSYPTSYIPTQGGAVTRVAESCEQTVPSDVIGQTEGVFFLDVGEYKSIGSISSAIIYLYNALGDRLGFAVSNTKLIRVRVNAVNEQIADTQVENSKTAIRYTSTGVDVFYNGVKQTLTIIGNEVFSLPTSVYLYSPNQSFDIKGLQLYNTALTDQELINLTTI